MRARHTCIHRWLRHRCFGLRCRRGRLRRRRNCKSVRGVDLRLRVAWHGYCEQRQGALSLSCRLRHPLDCTLYHGVPAWGAAPQHNNIMACRVCVTQSLLTGHARVMRALKVAEDCATWQPSVPHVCPDSICHLKRQRRYTAGIRVRQVQCQFWPRGGVRHGICCMCSHLGF